MWWCAKNRKKESPEPVPVVFFKVEKSLFFKMDLNLAFKPSKNFCLNVQKVQTMGKFVQVLKMVGWPRIHIVRTRADFPDVCSSYPVWTYEKSEVVHFSTWARLFEEWASSSCRSPDISKNLRFLISLSPVFFYQKFLNKPFIQVTAGNVERKRSRYILQKATVEHSACFNAFPYFQNPVRGSVEFLQAFGIPQRKHLYFISVSGHF